MPVKERFKQLKEETKRKENISAEDFHLLIGILQPTYNKYEKGSFPGLDKIMKIANALPDLNLFWLIKGEGNIWKEEVIDASMKNDYKNKIVELEQLLRAARQETIAAQRKAIEIQDRLIEAQDKIQELTNK